MRPGEFRKWRAAFLVAFSIVFVLAVFGLIALGFTAWTVFGNPPTGEAEMSLSLWSAIENFAAVLVYGGATALVVFMCKIVQTIATTPAPDQEDKDDH